MTDIGITNLCKCLSIKNTYQAPMTGYSYKSTQGGSKI